jgi:actin-related protein
MTRAGYAGEDTPRVMFPTSFGYVDTEEPVQQADGDIVMGENTEQQPTSIKKRNYYIGDNKINKFKSNMNIKNPLKDGLGMKIKS